MMRTPTSQLQIPHFSFLIRAVLFPHIEFVHCHRYSSMNQTFQRIDCAIETGGQHLDLFFSERLQHIVR